MNLKITCPHCSKHVEMDIEAVGSSAPGKTAPPCQRDTAIIEAVANKVGIGVPFCPQEIMDKIPVDVFAGAKPVSQFSLWVSHQSKKVKPVSGLYIREVETPLGWDMRIKKAYVVRSVAAPANRP